MPDNFTVHPQYSKYSEELREQLRNFASIGDNVTEGARNIIKKLDVDGKTFNIKKFKTPNFFQSLVYKYLRKSKARRSYEYALRLKELKINTPSPVAYLEDFSVGLNESYYISEHLAYDFDFRKLNHNPNFPDRDNILKKFARFSYDLHEKGVNFLDHSPGNTLIVDTKTGEERYKFYLIDLNRMKFEPLNLDQRMHNLRRLWLSKKMIHIIAKEYAAISGNNLDEVHRLMTKHSRAFQKKVNSKKLKRRRG